MTSVPLSPDGRLAAVASETMLRVGDLWSGDLSATLTADTALPTVAIPPNGRRGGAGDARRRVHFFDLLRPGS